MLWIWPHVQRPLPSLDSPCLLVCPVLLQHSDAWLCWCLRRNVKEISPSSPSHPPPPFYSLSNVPVYRWDVDDVDKRILHSLGFFWSWFVTVTVTVWKNKIRVRHASLGELRLKHSVSWITIKTDMLAVFHWDTNQVKSSKRLSNKERQITAWREKKSQWCWGEKMIIYFSNPLLDEYRRWNRFVVACLTLRDVVSLCRTRG